MYLYLTISLAGNEGGSGHVMDDLALAALAEGATVVSVIEHDGYWLSYAVIGGEARIVDTANDTAQLPSDIQEFWRFFRAIPRGKMQYKFIYRNETATP